MKTSAISVPLVAAVTSSTIPSRSRRKLPSQFVDERSQQFVDLDTVLASLRQQRIADDALVIGVLIHGIIGGFLEFVPLGANIRHQLGLCVARAGQGSHPCGRAPPRRCAPKG